MSDQPRELPTALGTIQTWRHSRKGVVRGRVIQDDGVWMQVELDGDHSLPYLSEANRGRVDLSGEVLTLRKSLMEVVDDDE